VGEKRPARAQQKEMAALEATIPVPGGNAIAVMR